MPILARGRALRESAGRLGVGWAIEDTVNMADLVSERLGLAASEFVVYAGLLHDLVGCMPRLAVWRDDLVTLAVCPDLMSALPDLSNR